jgi:hypothetical protein
MYEHERRWGPLTLALVIAAGVLVGGIALSVALWLLGLVAGVVMALLRIGVLIALAAGIVWGIKFLFRDRRMA